MSTVVLEFRLPTGSAGMAAGMTRHAIGRKLRAISDQHSIDYSSYIKNYRYYVVLHNSRDLIMLTLQWDSSNPWHRFNIVETVPTDARPL